MQLSAISHIPLSSDAYALDEDTLTIRIKAAKGDIKEISLFYGDRVCMQEQVVMTTCSMVKIASDGLFDYFELTFKSPYTRVCYYFYLKDQNGESMYYSEEGFTETMNLHRTRYFQFPYIHRADVIKAPNWTQDMIMYHIFPDSFASKKKELIQKEKEIIVDEKRKSKARLGGTLVGMIENLDYLTELGITCLYLNPIFLAESYHKYDTIDYYEIDPCFGTKQELKDLVKACHARNIKVLLDGVFNHCGSGFFAFLDVLKNQETSVYKDWFYQLQFPIQYQTLPNYEAFAYVKEMPKLNTANKEVEAYFCMVGAYWVKEADIDGWRLDVANEVNHDFWRAFKKTVQDVKKDTFFIGEIWESSHAWIGKDQFDSTMNYTFLAICKEFFAEKTIGIQRFDEKIQQMILRYPKQVSQVQMNFLDTHDVARFLSACKGNQTSMKFAVAFLMTCVGIPSVFYGDELLVNGESEAEYRKAMPWEILKENSPGKENRNQIWESKKAYEMFLYYKKFIQLRKEHKVLCIGEYKSIYVNEQQGIYAYMRYCNHFTKTIYENDNATRNDWKEQILIVMNFSEEERRVEVKNITELENKNNWKNLFATKQDTLDVLICQAKEVMVYQRMENDNFHKNRS